MIQTYKLSENELLVVVYALRHYKTVLIERLQRTKTIDNDFVRYAQQIVAIDNTIKELKQSHTISTDTNTHCIITSLSRLITDTDFAKSHPNSILFSKNFNNKAKKLYKPAVKLYRIIEIDSRYIKNII